MTNKLCCELSAIRSCRICGWKMCVVCSQIAEKRFGTVFTVRPLHDEVSNHKMSEGYSEVRVHD